LKCALKTHQGPLKSPPFKALKMTLTGLQKTLEKPSSKSLQRALKSVEKAL